MDLKQIAKDTAKTLISYLTYQAMRTVVLQLREMDPPQSIWLHQFSPTEKLQDGEEYLKALLEVKPDLAFRIMTVRAHLIEEIGEFLPEMASTGIQQANMEHRRQHLERVTQLTVADLGSHPEGESGSETTPDN